MSSSASPAPSRRKTLLSLGVLALLTGIVVFIFREHWAEISEALSTSPCSSIVRWSDVR